VGSRAVHDTGPTDQWSLEGCDITSRACGHLTWLHLGESHLRPGQGNNSSCGEHGHECILLGSRASYKFVVRPWQQREAKLCLQTSALLFMIASLSAGDGDLCCAQFSQCTGLQAESQRICHPQSISSLEPRHCFNHSCKVR
jgi:hypothetical protein